MKKEKGKAGGKKKIYRKGKKENKKDNRGAVEKFMPDQIVKAIEKSKGLLTGAARILKCSRTTVYGYMEQYPEVKEACKEANETTKDFAENKLIDAMDANNITAIIFYLKTKARDRGYVEKQEVEHSMTFDMAEWKKQRAERLKRVKDKKE
jgi:hypothetical protein